MDQPLERARSLIGCVERLADEGEIALGYVIAAYGIVIGSLCVYALRIHGQRRKLMGRGEQDPDPSRKG